MGNSEIILPMLSFLI